nr:mitochondrial mRNA pseudouridine synthase RPUSD3-like [Lytechinus pictus]
MNFCVRIFLSAPLAKPLLQTCRNSPVVCRTHVASCWRWRIGKDDGSSVSLQSTAKRRYHRQLLHHSNDWKDKSFNVNLLKRSIIYHQDGIVAINKPPGLGVSGRGNDSSSPLTLASMMSHIADITDCPSIEIAQGLEKEASGLVLLTENKMAAGKLQDKIKEARNRRQFIKTYQCIVCGIPEQKSGVSKMYLGTEDIGGINMTVVRHDPSGRQIRDGDVWSAETGYRVVRENRELGCALVELQPLRVRRHQLQVQMTNELCPILGDHTYSRQVKTILGNPVLMDPHKSLATHGIQVLRPGMRKALSMTNQQVSYLPLFLHLHRVVLPEWAGHRDVAIEAPLPIHFTRALKELGLVEKLKQLSYSAR